MNFLQYARVAVNVPQVNGLFDYSIPIELQNQVNVGALVTVPFNKQLVQGVVFSIINEPSVVEVKPIESIVENDPVVYPNQIALAKWMSEENFTNLAACIGLMLPPGLHQQADILLQLINDQTDKTDLSPVQSRIINLLQKRSDLRGRQIDNVIGHVDWRKYLPGLIKQGILRSQPILPPPTVKPKVVRTAQYMRFPQTPAELKTIGKPGSSSYDRRMRVIEFLNDEAVPVNVSFVYAESGAISADLNLLAETGLILLSETEIWRDPLANLKPVLTSTPPLTAEQEKAVQIIKSQLINQAEIKPILLQGVTGSGKTEVYLQAVEETLKIGKQVVILVPEISLTPQTVKRFFARFPGKVGLVHSRLSTGERYDTWRRIKAGLLPVVIGARSALFSPFNNLGLIVIDECHDGSYHQEEIDPHYHVINTAIEYAKICNAVLILGSATPEVEQVNLFSRQNWPLLKMPNRVFLNQENNQSQFLPLPGVEVVDMRAELVAGNRSALSRTLYENIKLVLEKQEQCILLLNRRGSSSYVFCRDCGYSVHCPRCETTMTYHQSTTELICHHCNYKRQIPKKCPQCNSLNIRQFGMGTESLEKLIVETFPSARVLRWDADTTTKKGAHDLILDHFSQHRADILVGTQMLAKGLDIPMVTLVGVILADISLNLPDFKAAERTFQLLTQVSGRAGRSTLGGKVILQTFQPDHYAIQKAAQHDVDGFSQMELGSRKKTGYPPFTRLIKIEMRHPDKNYLEKEMLAFGIKMEQYINVMNLSATSLIGPVPCFYQRKSGIYRWQLIIKGPDPVRLLKAHPISEWQPSKVDVDIVVDPVNIL